MRKEEALFVLHVMLYSQLNVSSLSVLICWRLERNILKRNLYSLFRNVIPEVVFDFLGEIGVFYKV